MNHAARDESKVILAQENWVMGLSLEANRVRALTAGWQKKAEIWDLDLNLLTDPISRELPMGLIAPYATEFRGPWMCLPNYNKADVWMCLPTRAQHRT